MTESVPSNATIEPKQLGGMVRRMRLRDGVVECSEKGEQMTGWANTPDIFRQQWGIHPHGNEPQRKATFQKARQLYKTNDWVGKFVDLMVMFCNDGIAINGIPLSRLSVEQWGQHGDAPAEEDVKMREWLRDCGFDFRKLAADIYLERVLCDNAVLFWRQADPTVLPTITVLDCEDVEVCNAFGIVYLKLKHKTVNLTADERALLGQRYVDALSGKELVIKNGEHDEYFRYLTAEKNGCGMRLPSLYQVFQDLSLREMLKMGDWNAAWMLKNIIRLVRRGHEIKQGALAGQDIHFLKQKEARKIKTGLAMNVGTFDMVTNFDLTISYSYMDAKYLDTAKYAGVKERLAAWAGPIARVMESKQVDPDAMRMFEVQCCALRDEVGLLLNRMFGSKEFLGEVTVPAPIQVTWSPITFINFKLMMERVRLAQSSGVSSTRTARENLGYDNAEESRRLKAEHNDPLSITPAFEQKQGMGAKNGRPEKTALPAPTPPTP